MMCGSRMAPTSSTVTATATWRRRKAAKRSSRGARRVSLDVQQGLRVGAGSLLDRNLLNDRLDLQGAAPVAEGMQRGQQAIRQPLGPFPRIHRRHDGRL